MAVVIVSHGERRRRLVANLQSLDLAILAADNLREARGVLWSHPLVDVVLTDVTLPDGNWCDVLTCLADRGVSASMVVCSPVADEKLWSEVLWRGVHDMLVEPYEDLEALRVVEGALRAARAARPSPRASSANKA